MDGWLGFNGILSTQVAANVAKVFVTHNTNHIYVTDKMARTDNRTYFDFKYITIAVRTKQLKAKI